MKPVLRSTACLAWLLPVAMAQAAPRLPKPADYPEPVVASTPSIEAKLVSGLDHDYRTRVREAMHQPVNFAGHYVLARIGCGTSCELGFAIDKLTGRTTWLPFGINEAATMDDLPPLVFDAHSRLFMLHGKRGEELRGGDFYYEFRKGRFVLIRTELWPLPVDPDPQ